MRATLILLTVSAFSISAPASAQTRPAAQEMEIVVEGRSLSETQRQLDACLARHCPPKEDIAATIAHAENQFLAGDYKGARRTLEKGHGRNARYDKILPVEVADLDRSFGRMANLNGFTDSGRFYQIRSLDALKAGLGKDDARVFAQRLLVGDEFARAGRAKAADDVYSQVAARARKAGELQIVGYALLRQAVLAGAIASSWQANRSDAEHKIRRLEATTEPELAPFRVAAKLLRAQLAMFDGDRAGMDRAIAAIPPQSDKPILVFSPPIRLDPRGTSTSSEPDPEWIDLRFRIAADGTVHDIEPVRDSGNVDTRWTKPVQASVSGRRYTPIALKPGSDGALRIERFSYVHDLVMDTGSRIPYRLTAGRISSLDITGETPRG